MWRANWSSYVLLGDLVSGRFLLLDDLVVGPLGVIMAALHNNVSDSFLL